MRSEGKNNLQHNQIYPDPEAQNLQVNQHHFLH